MSASGMSTSTDPTTEETTGSSSESSGSSSESSSGPDTTTGPMECMEIPEFDDMPMECPSDQMLAGPPITCLVGDTLAPGDDASTCAKAPLPGSGYGFIANSPGVWVFTVFSVGPEPDPLIVVFDDENNELGCSTDVGADPTPVEQGASVAVDLMPAQSVRIVVQPEAVPAGAPAPVVLRIAKQLDCGGDCCEADDARMGCEFEPFAECVCTVDDTCCSDGWTEDCVAIASGLCLASCGTFP